MQAQVDEGKTGVRGGGHGIGRRIRGNVLMTRVRKGRRKTITHAGIAMCD
jgi:hypothetical protein